MKRGRIIEGDDRSQGVGLIGCDESLVGMGTSSIPFLHIALHSQE